MKDEDYYSEMSKKAEQVYNHINIYQDIKKFTSSHTLNLDEDELETIKISLSLLKSMCEDLCVEEEVPEGCFEDMC